MNNLKEKDLIVGSKNEDVEKARRQAIEKAYVEKTKSYLQEEFMKNPQVLPIKMANRRILVPVIRVDEYKELIPGRPPIQKSEEQVQEELNKEAEKPLPVVAFDPALVDYGFKEGVVNYVIVSSFRNITKLINYKGLSFWVFELHEIVAFVDQKDVPLLTSKVSDKAVEAYKQKVSNESNIQSGTT